MKECFSDFEEHRDQHILVLTFPDPEVLNVARTDYLPQMNRAWLYIYVALFESSNPSLPSNFSAEEHLRFLNNSPSRIRYILGFTDMKEGADQKAVRYSNADLKAVLDFLANYVIVNRTTSAVQFELVAASHSEGLLTKKTVTKLQDLIFYAPPNLLGNTTKVDFKRMKNIIRIYGLNRVHFDITDDLRNINEGTGSGW